MNRTRRPVVTAHRLAGGERLSSAEEPSSPIALSTWLPHRVAHLGWGSTLLVVTPRLSESLIWVLHGMYRRGLNVFALVCTLQPQFKRVQKQADALGVSSHQVIWESDLLGMQKQPHDG